MKRIAIFGSINIDYFIETNVIPQSGETVVGNSMFKNYGGKGANQAVAAARLGGDVTLFGSIGNIEENKTLLKHFKQESVNVEHLNIIEDTTTGSGFIQLFNNDNRITIIPGANQFTNLEYSKKMLDKLLEFDIFVFQLEIPIESMEYLIPILHEHNKTIILDPAPAMRLSDCILEKVTFLTPNEHEISIIADGESEENSLLIKNPNKLIITLGTEGVKFFDGNEIRHLPARLVDAVDTTGAGDTFTGAFAVGIANGKSIQASIELGIVASSLSVTKKGAQAGMPSLHVVNSLIEKGVVT